MTNEELKQARANLCLSQDKLAARLGVSVRMIRYWEAGKWPVPVVIELAMRHLQNDEKKC